MEPTNPPTNDGQTSSHPSIPFTSKPPKLETVKIFFCLAPPIMLFVCTITSFISSLANIGLDLRFLVMQLGISWIGFGGIWQSNASQTKTYAVINVVIFLTKAFNMNEFGLVLWGIFFGRNNGSVFLSIWDGVVRAPGILLVLFAIGQFVVTYRYAKFLQHQGHPLTSYAGVLSGHAEPQPIPSTSTCCFCVPVDAGLKGLFVFAVCAVLTLLLFSSFFTFLGLYWGQYEGMMLAMSWYAYRGIFYKLVSDMALVARFGILMTVANVLPTLLLVFTNFLGLFIAFFFVLLSAYFSYVMYNYGKLLKELGYPDVAFPDYEMMSLSDGHACI